MTPPTTVKSATTMETAKAGPAAIGKPTDFTAMIEAAECAAVHA